MPPILIDIGSVPEEQCDHCLDELFKALSQNPDGDVESIWRPVENPFLTRHVESVTARFQAILERIQNLFSEFLLGKPLGDLQKAEVPWLRWDADKFAETQRYLDSKPQILYTLDDWMLVAEWIVQRYLPDGVINSEAEHLTVRAALLGKIQANLERPRGNPNRPDIDAIVDLTPMDFGQIPPKILSPIELSVIHVAKANAALNISSVTDKARNRMRSIVIEHVQAQMLGMREGQHTAMRQRLFDEFGQLNRDFRRIAVTEAGDACNQGYIAAQKPGTKVRRMEAYKGACAFCKSINGETFRVVEPSDPKKDGDHDVWVGKTNIGRSASPRKREGGALVERPSNDRWWPAAGVQHPHCRGAWVATVEKPPEVSQEFADWLEDLIAKAKPPAL